MSGPRCCGLHHTSYCPEMRGTVCGTRVAFNLDRDGGNEEKFREILEMEKAVVKKWEEQTHNFPKKAQLDGMEIRQTVLDEFWDGGYDSSKAAVEEEKNDIRRAISKSNQQVINPRGSH